MKNIFGLILLSLLVFNSGCFAQAPANVNVQNPKFNNRLELLLSFSVPVIDVNDLAETKDNYLLLDAREMEEYEVSHIEGAEYIGYDYPRFEMLNDIPKDQPIVLYCSIGYRSEKLGEKLKKQGFTNVQNLYGSIFEWTNEGLPLVDKNGKPTDKIHTYNKKWSKWVKKSDKVEKVW